MLKQKFVCRRCDRDFVAEVLEPGEAEARNVHPVPIRCPKCGGPVESA